MTSLKYLLAGLIVIPPCPPLIKWGTKMNLNQSPFSKGGLRGLTKRKESDDV